MKCTIKIWSRAPKAVVTVRIKRLCKRVDGEKQNPNCKTKKRRTQNPIYEEEEKLKYSALEIWSTPK